jgi:hypothetical protein
MIAEQSEDESLERIALDPWKGCNEFLYRGIGLPGRKHEGVSLLIGQNIH